VDYRFSDNTDPWSPTSTNHLRIYNEDGTVLFSKDSASTHTVIDNNGNAFASILNINNGVKLVVRNVKVNDQSIEMYSLPGTLIASNNKAIKSKKGILSSPIPNPSSEVAKVEFTLPEGVNKGELQIYTTKGVLVKKFTVDRTFGYLMLDNSDLEPGTYLYKLDSDNSFSEVQKMLVIK
jgi:hypothetical protein